MTVDDEMNTLDILSLNSSFMLNSDIVLYDSEPTLSDIRLIDFDPEKALKS